MKANTHSHEGIEFKCSVPGVEEENTEYKMMTNIFFFFFVQFTSQTRASLDNYFHCNKAEKTHDTMCFKSDSNSVITKAFNAVPQSFIDYLICPSDF